MAITDLLVARKGFLTIMAHLYSTLLRPLSTASSLESRGTTIYVGPQLISLPPGDRDLPINTVKPGVVYQTIYQHGKVRK